MIRRNNYSQTSWSDRFIVRLLDMEIREQLQSCFIQKNGEKLKILDAGCGEQPLRMLIENEGHAYFSLDIEQNSQSNVDFIGRLDGDTGIPATHLNTFDLIICTEVLEHVLDWHVAFKRFQNILKPKGFVLITCPFHFYLHETPFDYWRPTHFAITAFAERYDFSIISNRQLGDMGDILGTYIGVTSFKPADKSIKGKLIHYYLRFLHKGIYWAVVKGWYKKQHFTHNVLYLSNSFLLRYSEKEKDNFSQ